MNLDIKSVRHTAYYKNQRSVRSVDDGQKKRGLFNYREIFHRFLYRVLSGMLTFALIMAISGVFTHIANAGSKVRIVKGDEWSYFKGKKMPPRKWNHFGFDDDTWQKGKSNFGYGKNSLETSLSDMRGNYSTIYARQEFSVNPSKIKRINLSVVCNGPFVAYINGIEVARSEKSWSEPIDITGFAHELHSGKNLLAVECSNDDINGNSFEFSPSFEILEK